MFDAVERNNHKMYNLISFAQRIRAFFLTLFGSHDDAQRYKSKVIEISEKAFDERLAASKKPFSSESNNGKSTINFGGTLNEKDAVGT